ncbi:MAG: hypothetical protein O7H41_01425 [Planctomycetota bacterium]|nr:hypothetical protein [Planctomycetota bacterium]
MTAVDLFLELRGRGVTFTLKGEAVTYRGPAGVLDPGTLARLREAKPIILGILKGEVDLNPGEQRIIIQWRDANSEDFARLLSQHHDSGMITGEAEIQTVADLIAREFGIDRPKPSAG